MSERSTLSVFIERPAAEAYEFLSVPENFAKWASGLAGSLRRDGDDWIADTPQGPARVRFSDRNSRGVLDHSVTLPDGATVFVPLRIVPKGEACELILTLNRQPGMSDEKFAADAQWVMRDLNAAKSILERRTELQ
ncbi:MAG: SRPBCC family protein [Betaproteobacteria bacterium]|nr:MAG: SRPBCC family protein [Betaproteobacteria bacterium]